MASPLHYVAVGHDEKLVGPADRREAVGNDDGRPPLQCRVERALHSRFGFRVEVGGGFVEDNHVRRLEEKTGERDALFLAARQPITPVADNCVEAVGQRLDEREDLRPLDGVVELLGGRVGFAVEQVRGGSSRGRGAASWLTTPIEDRREAKVASRTSTPFRRTAPLRTS